MDTQRNTKTRKPYPPTHTHPSTHTSIQPPFHELKPSYRRTCHTDAGDASAAKAKAAPPREQR